MPSVLALLALAALSAVAVNAEAPKGRSRREVRRLVRSNSRLAALPAHNAGSMRYLASNVRAPFARARRLTPSPLS